MAIPCAGVGILALEWNQIDFASSVIRLRAGETKNDEGREVPITPQLNALLEERYAKRDPSCHYVCFRFDGKGHAVKLNTPRKAWASALRQAGLGEMLFHDLRRSGVRNLVRAGVPERVAMEISGHRTRSVFERYNIVSAADIREAGRKLATFHAEQNNHNSITIEVETSTENSVIN